MEKWQADIGPRQLKDLQRAMRELNREAATHDELTGVVGGAEHRSTYWVPFGGGYRPEVAALDEAIRERFSYQVTRKNVRDVIQAYADALPEAAKSRPTVDNRRSQAEDTELQAKISEREAGYQAKRDAEAALLEQVLAKAPAGAQALIVAQLMEDQSDTQTDYFSNKTVRSVAIGFRTGKREDFRQLHAAAARFPETAHLADEIAFSLWLGEDGPEYLRRDGTEHRDNYSMGKGNYLSDHGWDGAGSGWVVKSYTLPATWARLTEDAVPEQPEPPRGNGFFDQHGTWVPQAAPGEVTVSEGRNGNTEVRFPEAPAAEVRKGLKDHGFRWNGRDMCWYGKDASYADQVAGKEVAA